jgi:uncharacterized membrane protein YbhN (UPF0104 family)
MLGHCFKPVARRRENGHQMSANVRGERRWLSAARIAAAPLLLALVVWLSGPRALVAVARDAHLGWLAAGLASSLLSNLLSAPRWRHLIRWLGHEVGLRWAVAVNFRALAAGAVLPGSTLGGDVLRVWYLHRHGCAAASASLSVLLDRLSGLWMVWGLGAAGLAVGAGTASAAPLQQLAGLPPGWPLQPVALGMLTSLLLLPLLVLAGWRASGRGSRRVRLLLRQPRALGSFGWHALVSLAVQLFSVGSLACAALAFGITLPLWLLVVTAAPIFLLASLPISFGGWGTRELAAVSMWAAFGVAAPQSAGASIAFGLFALAQAVLGLLPVPGRPAIASPAAAPAAAPAESPGLPQA